MRRLLPAIALLAACASSSPTTEEPSSAAGSGGSKAGASGASVGAGSAAGSAGVSGTGGGGTAGVAGQAGAGAGGAVAGTAGAAGAGGSPFGAGGAAGAGSGPAGAPSCAKPVPVAGSVSLGGAPCVSDPSSDYLCDSFCGGDYTMGATCTKGMGPPSAFMSACAQAGFVADTYCCRLPVCKPAKHVCPSGQPYTCSPGLYPKMTYSCAAVGGDPSTVCCSPS